MKLPRLLSLLVFIGLVPFVSAQDNAPANPIFGSYEALIMDHDMLQGVKVDGVGDIFIMFQDGQQDTQLSLKISMADGSQYRKWFTGDEVLIAQENSGRGVNVWTDRVQTTANYIEYWANGKIFLKLKKIKG